MRKLTQLSHIICLESEESDENHLSNNNISENCLLLFLSIDLVQKQIINFSLFQLPLKAPWLS